MSLERKEFYLFSAIMALIMSGGMSLAMGLLTVDVSQAISTWPNTWFMSFWVALPLSIFVVPVTQKIVDSIFRTKEEEREAS
ncbi:DUF2798 domain-containing protein [Vibrio penaeicida]|uniref:DUF2798 domain-containing protein n=1 Tax=Vibrio penaeicida TaxID=104609 RepID=A0AAV5NME2_9VIBR|nr:DUF2798 domain-containing protein [Vibrio penaeicida]RTZ21974.1 DUF2798 domain-containing protein [Vibrio penaeicida]GLQ71831.1 hypothetical protein GCM10007932_11910 [Vibrio penaeicida]